MEEVIDLKNTRVHQQAQGKILIIKVNLVLRQLERLCPVRNK